MMVIPRTLVITLLILQPLFVSADEMPYCVEITAPVISVADFDANGVVNRKDIKILAKYIRKSNKFNSRHSRHYRDNDRGKSHRSRHHRDRGKSHRSRHHRDNEEVVYSPMLDRNADGKINHIDVYLTARDMGKSSTEEDQKLADISNEILEGNYSCIESVEEVPAPVVEEPAPVVEEPAPVVEEPAPVVEEPAPVEIIYNL